MFAGRILLSSLLLSALPAVAAIFDFDSLPPDTISTTFTQTVDGVTATFSSQSGAGAFTVGPNFPFLDPRLAGNELYNLSIPNAVLDILFDQYSTDISLAFALNTGANPGFTYPLRLTAYAGTIGGASVGSATVDVSVRTPGIPMSEGFLSFSSVSPFHAVRIDTFQNVPRRQLQAPFIVVDSIDFGQAIPEPGSIALVLSGLAVVFVSRRRLTHR